MKTNAERIREMQVNQLEYMWFYIRDEVVKGEQNDHIARSKILEWLKSSSND